MGFRVSLGNKKNCHFLRNCFYLTAITTRIKLIRRAKDGKQSQTALGAGKTTCDCELMGIVRSLWHIKIRYKVILGDGFAHTIARIFRAKDTARTVDAQVD